MLLRLRLVLISGLLASSPLSVALAQGPALSGHEPVVATENDWPHWMGPTGDGIWHESNVIEAFPPEGPVIRWRHEVGGGYGGPATSQGRLFIMDRTEDEGLGGEVENDIRSRGEVAGGERVQCLDITTGEVLWEHRYDCPYKVAYPTGPRCTPTVDGEHVYTLGAMGDLICLRVADGSVVWQKSLTEAYGTKPPPWGFSSHPVVDGERLLVPVGGEGSGVVAFDKLTGDELWRAVTTLDVAYAPLVFAEPLDGTGDRQLIFWHADGITSLNPDDGNEYWTVTFPEERNPSQTSIATPVVVGNKIFISEFYKGSLLLEFASDPPSIKEIWRSHKTDPRNQESLNAMMATPIVRDGYAYGIAYNPRGQGILRCIELETGKHVWTEEAWMSEKPLTFATAFWAENEGRFWMFNDNGELMITELSPEGYMLLDKTPIVEPTSAARGRKVVWSNPAWSNGCAFIRNDKEIVCVELAQSSGE